MRLFRRLHTFFTLRARRGDRGAVLIIVIPAIVMAIFASALGVDIGRTAVDKRNDQSVADAAALDAARALIPLNSSLAYSVYQSAAQTEAQASALRNKFTRPDQVVTATVGSIDPTTNTFRPGNGNTAVRVVAASFLQHAFVPSGRNLSAQAIVPVPYADGGHGCLTLPCNSGIPGDPGNPSCTTPICIGTPIASFSVGSTLAGLDTSRSFLDPTLKGMLGASGSLSAVSYDGLATGNVSLGALQAALVAAGISVGTVDQLLNTDIKVKDLLLASASALGASTARTEINDLIAANINATATIKLNQLLDVAAPSDSAVLSATMNVYQFVTGAAELMNGSSFGAVSTGLSLGNYGTADISVKLISPAQTGIGPVGTTAENAQGVVKLVLHVKTSVLTASLPTLGTPVDVTLLYNVGEAKGTLTSIICGASPSIGVSANTSAVSVTGTATALLAGTITVSPSTIAGSGPTALTFNHPGGFAPTSQRVPNSTNSVSSTSITYGGTGTLLSTVVNAVTNPLSTVVSTVLTTLGTSITPALKALGIDVGAADIAALGIFPSPSDCSSTPTIAQ